MIKTFLLLILLFFTTSLQSQNYERYKKFQDTTINSKNLGFNKNIGITVPVEWQKGIDNKYPLIIIFDRQNKRSHQYIINTIDYLTSNEQMPSSVIISVASEQKYRYSETSFKISEETGLGEENEKFIFEELIPFAEKKLHASSYRLLIGHSRYGYFTTSLFHSRINELNGVIAISPFFTQKNVDLTDSIKKLDTEKFSYNKYYHFAIGNDFPEDYIRMDAVVSTLKNNLLHINGHHYKQADHNVTPGIMMAKSLYEIFENWSAIQSLYIKDKSNDSDTINALNQKMISTYATKLNFSLGIMNGKGWAFYNDQQYDKAIEAWELLLISYPNFSEAYLYILKSQIELGRDSSETILKFKKSLMDSEFYSPKHKSELEKELNEMIK